MNILPKEWCPMAVEEFIGPAQFIAGEIEAMSETYKPRKVQASILTHGFPGCGKSSLAKFAMHCFGVCGHSLTKKNGTDMTVDAVRSLDADLKLPSCLPGYRGIWIDEVDAMPKVAQTRLLTLADDLPKGTILFCTCNSHINELEPRFPSRFQAYEVVSPKGTEIAKLLLKWFDQNEVDQLINIATDGKPNTDIDVRAIMADATTQLIRKGGKQNVH